MRKIHYRAKLSPIKDYELTIDVEIMTMGLIKVKSSLLPVRKNL